MQCYIFHCHYYTTGSKWLMESNIHFITFLLVDCFKKRNFVIICWLDLNWQTFLNVLDAQFSTILYKNLSKGDLISEDILTLVSLPTKSAKSLTWVENLNNLNNFMAGNSRFLLMGVIWHLLLAMGPKPKYLLRLIHL